MSESRRLGRSVVAVFVGVLVGAALSLGVDEVLHMMGIYPPWGERMSDGLFVLATAYRLVFSVLGCYVIARLAPNRPMAHALVGGAIGLVLSVAGAVATWNLDIGPHWYSVLLAVTALPCAWVGGWLWLNRMKAQPTGRLAT
ncbi:hypothetical protein [Edaphobacter aggregans]|uniref:hypothetical protein n=1 Tax=Edaphobacter aggregans TaxID=570835 RepID=UPI00054FCE59|nr:hypothetical protein [Edaphobacter aggregans]